MLLNQIQTGCEIVVVICKISKDGFLKELKEVSDIYRYK